MKKRRKHICVNKQQKKNTFDPSADDFGCQHYQKTLQVNKILYTKIQHLFNRKLFFFVLLFFRFNFKSEKFCGFRLMLIKQVGRERRMV